MLYPVELRAQEKARRMIAEAARLSRCVRALSMISGKGVVDGAAARAGGESLVDRCRRGAGVDAPSPRAVLVALLRVVVLPEFKSGWKALAFAAFVLPTIIPLPWPLSAILAR
jgi:hypothetical protein